ncbi:saf1-like protein [Elsinoe australis]|uniref:Saf1-like protein n=1 Tax=Elsinoe australis TaxID=40998 RepID=A0A4U7AQ53_9PEZI|nr:saf1-like protein [Elsinoe australis]
MPKEKSHNPVAAHAKAQKRAEHKKTKATVQAQRTERLAKRNPARLEKQIAELKALESHGSLKPRDQEVLKGLERDLGLVRRAREHAGLSTQGGAGRGDEDGRRGGRGAQDARRRELGVGQKRRREEDEDGSETDPEVRGIPMPRDTPPPVPRRERREEKKEEDKPVQVTYSSEPVLKDFKKAATEKRFAPAQVRRNLDRAKGKGGLVEEEEWERLERAGYAGGGTKGEVETEEKGGKVGKVGSEDAEQGRKRGVMMEEVEDEDL